LKKSKFFYGWIVVLSCTLLAFSVNAMGNNALTFYVASISDAFQVNRATTNFMLFTMGLLTRTVLGLFFGKLTARFGVKRLMVVGLGFVIAGYLAYSFAGSIAMIGLGSALYGIAHAIGTLSSYNVIINNWFTKNKGLMLAIINTAVGVGGMVINPLVGGWIERFGWNQSFLNTLLLIVAIAIPSLIMVRAAPRADEVSEVRVAPVEAVPQTGAAHAPEGAVLAVRQALRESRFWLLVVIQMLIGFSMGPSFSNAIPALRAMGVNATFVSNVLSVLIAFGIVVGHVSSGLLFDRFGLGLLMNVAVGIVSVGMIAMGFLTATSPSVLLILTVACIGYSNALSLGTLSHMINSVFATERKDFSSLFGFLFAVQNIGVMIGSPVSGMFFDSTGSYQYAYWLSVVLLVLALVLLRLTLKMKGRVQTGS
jgi:MFS family permease